MKRYIILLVCLISSAAIAASNCVKTEEPTPEKTKEKTPQCDSAKIEQILLKMHNATKELNSCQAKLAYLFIQDPELWDTQALQNGMLYYQKNDGRSYLRIRFDDRKEDDFKPEKQREEYLFDGVWLTRIDYKLKQIDRIQKATEDKPIDVFELISNQFPLVGFSNIDQLRKDFDVQLAKEPDKDETSIELLLSVKKGSKYEKEYKKIDFWVANDTYMPVRIVATSSQDDIHDIKFQDFQINKKFKKAVFTVETPSDFRQNIEPLEEKSSGKGN